MNDLTTTIRQTLAVKKQCTVFEPEVSRRWPLSPKAKKKRNDAIQAFAKEIGCRVDIRDPGIRVIFRNLE